MKGLLFMTENSYNKFHRQYIFLKEEILLKKRLWHFTGLAYVVQFGVELKSLILIRLHSDLVVRPVRYVWVISNRNDLMAFETSIDKINMRICTVYVSGRSDLGLCISPTECIMSASSVNTALQNGGNSNQSALFTFKLRTLHRLSCFCSGSNKNKCAANFWSIFWSACVSQCGKVKRIVT